MYASFLGISEALHLDIFHQPLRNRFFDGLGDARLLVAFQVWFDMLKNFSLYLIFGQSGIYDNKPVLVFPSQVQIAFPYGIVKGEGLPLKSILAFVGLRLIALQGPAKTRINGTIQEIGDVRPNPPCGLFI